MSFVKKNKGVIIFYLVLVLATLVIVQNNSKNLEENKGYVYLTRQIFSLYLFKFQKIYYNNYERRYIMNNKVMSGKAAKALVIFSALFLILLGVGLYKLFEYQGYDKKKTNNLLIIMLKIIQKQLQLSLVIIVMFIPV